ncbi:hypothetical protein [Bosea sp. 117]|uniref:hypothetical protein n=1 Tax=Bosea sp. 117 TaxID=1125973 RepID=UPI0004948B6C|nr:hypothetical protein [Bosea sp. 117]
MTHLIRIAAVTFGLMFGLVLFPAPSHAQLEGFVNSVTRNVIREITRGPGHKCCPKPSNKKTGGQTSKNTRQNGDTAEATPDKERDTRVLQSLAPPSKVQVAVLKDIVPSATLGLLGSNDDLDQVGSATSKDAERDYLVKIEQLIGQFQRQQQKASSDGDVTAHGIEVSLDEAIKDAKLTVFASFKGENWSEERLKVMILSLVETQIGSLFDGTNRGKVAMSDVDAMIRKSAKAVYGRLFETSELLAANLSSAMFLQKLYQTHGSAMTSDVREGTERMLTKAASTSAQEFDPLLRRDENAFALEYRLQRIVFDCLTANMEAISSAPAGMATRQEIEQRIEEKASGACASWVAFQFRDEAGKLKSQQPMPVRTVWSATGPQDDPSMYGRGSGAL